jgi:anhydro-N-acetylmuramic acid kinase
VLRAFRSELTIFELSRLQYVVGAVYAEAARELVEMQQLKPEQVNVIGVDGQTVYQEPPKFDLIRTQSDDLGIAERWLNGSYWCGLFDGEGAIVATYTQIPTVTHFRAGDHALGGTGAPLMQYLDFVSFRDAAPVARHQALSSVAARRSAPCSSA